MNVKISSFEDLDVWKRCRELKNIFIKLAKSFPKDERFRLTDQLVRAARSVTNNIAEGYGRFHYKENTAELAEVHCMNALTTYIVALMKKYLMSIR